VIRGHPAWLASRKAITRQVVERIRWIIFAVLVGSFMLLER
jgi:hypothetical protein